jgi:acyl-coenzyme A thioesterase PaaI-like protein
MEACFIARAVQPGLYDATPSAVGPWDPRMVQGSAFGALMAHTLESIECARGFLLSRLTFDFLRPVPQGPLEVKAAVLREGRKSRLAEVRLTAAGGELARATALYLRGSADLESLVRAAPPPAPPESGREPPWPVRRWSPFFEGVETRVISGELQMPGPASAWLRLLRPVVAGCPNSALMLAVSAADLGGGISAIVDLRATSFANADLNIAFWRAPKGEWMLAQSTTWPQARGTGIAVTQLYDLQGQFGIGQQGLVFERRAA